MGIIKLWPQLVLWGCKGLVICVQQMVVIVTRPTRAVPRSARCPLQPNTCHTHFGHACLAPKPPLPLLPPTRHNERGSLQMVRGAALPAGWSSDLRPGLLVWLYLLSQQVCEIWDKYLNNRYQVLTEARVQQIDLLGKQFETDTGLGKWQFSLRSRAVTSSQSWALSRK